MNHPFIMKTMAEIHIQELQKEALWQTQMIQTNQPTNSSRIKPIAVMARTLLVIVLTILIAIVIWISAFV